MLRTAQDIPVSVHEDIALHTVEVSLFTDLVFHTVEVIIFTIRRGFWCLAYLKKLNIEYLLCLINCVIHSSFSTCM